MKITGVVERNDNNYYQISSNDEVMGHCFGGYGYSVAEAKADFAKSIEEAKAMIAEEGLPVPKELEEAVVEFRYDIPSFFNDFDWINVSKFAKRAGINESKMRAYKSGVASASERTTKKILCTIRQMGKELCDATV